MAMFVHLTSEKYVKSIIKNGIKAMATKKSDIKGVYAMAVTPNYFISHQWLRELKADGQRTISGIYLRISDNEKVYLSHYNSEGQEVMASEAVGIIMNNENSEGYEIIIPRKIEAKEIHKTRSLPQVVGWRYSPDSHSRPYCGCPACVRQGTVNSNKKNLIWESKQ